MHYDTLLRLARSLLITGIVVNLLGLTAAEAGKPAGNGDGPSYDVIKLDDVNGTIEGFAHDVNDSRLVVGVARDFASNMEAACCWTVVKTKRSIQSTLHLLDGGGRAWGCNEAGEIVGDGNARAVYWTARDAVAQALPAPPDGMPYGANAISNDGVICGGSVAVPGEVASALVWRVTPGGASEPLELAILDPDPLGFDFVVANDVSDQDKDGVITIVGESNGNAVTWTVMLSDDGGLLPGPASILSSNAVATATNNFGLACGRAAFAPNKAVAWFGGTPLILDHGNSPYTVSPYDVNNTGVIVGVAGGLSGEAVFWPGPADAMISLNKFLKNSAFDSLKSAEAVNQSGDIVGYGRINNLDFYPAFLAIPK